MHCSCHTPDATPAARRSWLRSCCPGGRDAPASRRVVPHGTPCPTGGTTAGVPLPGLGRYSRGVRIAGSSSTERCSGELWPAAGWSVKGRPPRAPWRSALPSVVGVTYLVVHRLHRTGSMWVTSSLPARADGASSVPPRRTRHEKCTAPSCVVHLPPTRALRGSLGSPPNGVPLSCGAPRTHPWSHPSSRITWEQRAELNGAPMGCGRGRVTWSNEGRMPALWRSAHPRA